MKELIESLKKHFIRMNSIDEKLITVVFIINRVQPIKKITTMYYSYHIPIIFS